MSSMVASQNSYIKNLESKAIAQDNKVNRLENEIIKYQKQMQQLIKHCNKDFAFTPMPKTQSQLAVAPIEPTEIEEGLEEKCSILKSPFYYKTIEQR